MEEKKVQSKTRALPIWIVIAVCVLVFFIFGGQSARVSCKHTRQLGLVNCTKQSRLLWVFPIKTQTINSVSGAQLNETEDYEGDTTYRVELITSQGIVPLTSIYTSGYSTKRDVVGQINAFVQNANATVLEVNEPGLLSGENIICMLIWFPISYLFSKVCEAVRSGLRRS